MEGIGTRIRKTRKAQGLTIQDLAQKSGMSVMSIRRYETGDRQPLIKHIEKIAAVLGVTPAYLIGLNSESAENGVKVETALISNEVVDRLAAFYRSCYDDWKRLADEAAAAGHDDDEEAFRAITRRANKKSDFMEGFKAAVNVFGIDTDEFLATVNADHTAEQ